MCPSPRTINTPKFSNICRLSLFPFQPAPSKSRFAPSSNNLCSPYLSNKYQKAQKTIRKKKQTNKQPKISTPKNVPPTQQSWQGLGAQLGALVDIVHQSHRHGAAPPLQRHPHLPQAPEGTGDAQGLLHTDLGGLHWGDRMDDMSTLW